MQKIIVSRHSAAIQFIARELDGSIDGDVIRLQNGEIVPVIAQALPSNVEGKIVFGNLPLSLCVLAIKVCTIEFSGPPPRGQEYDLAAMDAAGASLQWYQVYKL